METIRYPVDLAKAVFSVIKKRSDEIPSLDLLTSLFENVYFASIKSEESESIIFNIVYLDPENPDPDPPEIIVSDRWSYVELREPISFNLQNLIKLAKASDPRTSSLAVYHDDNENLFIWGLIDQGNRYHDFVNYESEEGPERPGIFQASIEAPGYVTAYLGYKKIAELRVNRLVRKSVDVFQDSPIREALQPGVDRYLRIVKRKAGSRLFNDRPHWEENLTDYWFSTICRLILRIKSHRHGGALLLTSETSPRGLNIKYPISYDRLKKALISRATLLIEKTYASDRIFEYLDKESDIPDDLYLDESVAESELVEIRSEMDGTLWFMSLLSRVDGLILMDKQLAVRGFGVEIRSSKPPSKVYTCSSQSVRGSSLKEVDYNHYGTRHRSMMRYCWRYPGNLGFVISQDGDVRTMIRVDDSIVIWENIKLQAYTFVKRRPLISRRRLKK